MPLILGFLIGIIVKGAMKIGAALIVIMVLLIVIGMISTIHVIGQFVSMVRTGQGMVVKVNQIAGYLPYSSPTFKLGVVTGLFKGYVLVSIYLNTYKTLSPLNGCYHS